MWRSNGGKDFDDYAGKWKRVNKKKKKKDTILNINNHVVKGGKCEVHHHYHYQGNGNGK